MCNPKIAIGTVLLVGSLSHLARAGELKPIKECAAEFQLHKQQIKSVGVTPAAFFRECWWHTNPGEETTITKTLPKQMAFSLAPARKLAQPRIAARPRISWTIPTPFRSQRMTATLLDSRRISERSCDAPRRSRPKPSDLVSGGAELHPESLRQLFNAKHPKPKQAAL